ncbi:MULTISPECIES: hypothetical protein [Arthrobacter]|uniref:HTH cro/C1-type domain-containing protein n=2 Tax=Arthrobacter TaxID=1663 RepID=A0ABU9KHI1_9MICC|nr:hypothetical protein [Arthrobacter sp. YJM1]MDP5226640.1 hypothetical protein [Arthrobacter sp. YJM1]
MGADDKQIGKNLATLRGERSQQDVASQMRALGYKWSQATVWAVEKGERPLKVVEAVALAGLFSKTLDDLLSSDTSFDLALDELESAIAALKPARAMIDSAMERVETLIVEAPEELLSEREARVVALVEATMDLDDEDDVSARQVYGEIVKNANARRAWKAAAESSRES